MNELLRRYDALTPEHQQLFGRLLIASMCCRDQLANSMSRALAHVPGMAQAFEATQGPREAKLVSELLDQLEQQESEGRTVTTLGA